MPERKQDAPDLDEVLRTVVPMIGRLNGWDTQEKLGKACGVSQQVMNRLLRGRKGFEAAHLSALMRSTGYTARELMAMADGHMPEPRVPARFGELMEALTSTELESWLQLMRTAHAMGATDGAQRAVSVLLEMMRRMAERESKAG